MLSEVLFGSDGPNRAVHLNKTSGLRWLLPSQQSA
nr:MAG TPA: hypothetical protein [Bacteriophage sp.]